MSSPVPVVDLAPNLEKCFFFDATPASYEITGVSGRIPEWLRGTYYVNGPARFERAGRRYKHWLDGDGMVRRLHFGADGVTFTARFVDTPKLRDEEAAGEFLYRGFGTSWPGDRLRRNVMLEGPANVSVYPYNGVLLAFAEQSIPFELDPVTLETRGVYDFQGRVNEVTPFVAHAKYDRGHLLNFGISFSAKQPALHTYEFDSAGILLKRRRYPLQYQHSNHDFAYTTEHMLFFLSPLLMDFGRFWGDGVSVMESLSWEPDKGSRILVTPRAHRNDEAFTIDAGGGYCLHVVNAFEADNRIYFDLLLLDEPVYREYQPVPDLFPTVAPCRAVRYIIDLETRTLVDTIRLDDYDRAPDFPSVGQILGGQPYSDFWMLGISQRAGAGRKFFDELAHGSWSKGCVDDVYCTPYGEYLGGEPVFVQNPSDPADGVIISEHHIPAEDRGEFVLFNAARVADGPIARLPLKYKIHPGFHTSFTTR
jgi:carotenoid cleavage dioxygenase-like enzyme